MRPAAKIIMLFALLLLLDAILLGVGEAERRAQRQARPRLETVVAALGLTDLCLATEARYTRHPAVTDSVAPFMDHPGALEHFPTGSFWAPPLLY